MHRGNYHILYCWWIWMVNKSRVFGCYRSSNSGGTGTTRKCLFYWKRVLNDFFLSAMVFSDCPVVRRKYSKFCFNKLDGLPIFFCSSRTTIALFDLVFFFTTLLFTAFQFALFIEAAAALNPDFFSVVFFESCFFFGACAEMRSYREWLSEFVWWLEDLMISSNIMPASLILPSLACSNLTLSFFLKFTHVTPVLVPFRTRHDLCRNRSRKCNYNRYQSSKNYMQG